MKSLLSRIPAARPSKTWIALGVALLIGLAAALAARSYLNQQMQAIEARSKTTTKALLVAKRELRKGEALSRDTVAVREVPKDYAHSNAIAYEDYDRVAGELVEYSVRPGEILMWSLMRTQKVPTFSARVGIGRRAITVHVDEINSISGLLEPGDSIDLMLTLERSGRKTTFPLLQNVQVMATGQRSVDDPRSGERRQYSTVTLDTTQAQAQSVIIAREAGKITALLRNPGDTQVVEGDSAAMSALLGLGGDVQTLADSTGTMAGATRTVPVLYGGRRTDFKPEELALRHPQADRDEGAADAAHAAASTSARDIPAQPPGPTPSAPSLLNGDGSPAAPASPLPAQAALQR